MSSGPEGVTNQVRDLRGSSLHLHGTPAEKMHVMSLRQEREGRRDTELGVTESFNYAPLDCRATYSSGMYLDSPRISGSEILSLGFK